MIKRYRYPEYEKLNDILYPMIRDEKKYHISEGTGKRTTFNIHRKKELRNFVNWVREIFPNHKIAISWCVVYNKGEGARKHSHEPYPMTFVYYINLPEGSSPLIVEDKTINVSSGELVVFSGNKYHEVSPSTVDGRCVIAGNFTSTSF